jgi:biopolymer transport protein ExbD
MSVAGRKRRKSLRLICEINVAAFAGVMLALFAMFALPQMWPLFVPETGGYRTAVDLANVPHPRDMREANRADAIWVAIQRTGDVWLRNDRLRPPYENLSRGIRERVKAGSEDKVYINADSRAKYSCVRQVLEAVQSSGVEKVAFLVWQRSRPYPAPQDYVKTDAGEDARRSISPG